MISEIIEKWIKGILIDGITGNLSGLFDNVNAKVGEIASDVGSTPQAWNSGIFNMLRSLSETVVLPIAAAILALVMCHELIQMITEKNNMHDFDTSMFFRWIFKSAFAILIVSNTWNIVMGVFDATQSVVNQSSGVIIGETSIHFDRLIPGLEFQLESMTIGSLLSLWFQTLVVGLTMNILSICIFLVTYGRMIEIYVVTALGPIPLATMGSSEWRSTGQNYLKSLLALGFQAFLIMIVVGIYAVLIRNISGAADIAGAIWGCMGYTVLTKLAAEGGERVAEFAARNWKTILIVAVFGLLALLLITGLQSCTVMAGTAGTGVTASSYFSKDKDMLGAEKAYAKLEQKLQRYLDTYEATHNYDEYHFYLDEIEHDPYVLISILSALHDGVFTLAEVQGELEMLFEKQYILTETVTMQIRYRTKMMVIIGPYGVPQVITYQEPYEYYICTVKLKNKDLSHLPVEVLTEEQLSAYSLYMRTLGNRPDLFGQAQYPNASTIKQPTYYDIPPEALKDDRFAAMMEEATKYIGYPYVWGGSSPSTSFDCSGYISWVLNHSGWNVGRQTAQGLYNLCTPVSTAQVKPGDLVFFKGTYDTPGVSHCGIYVGNSIMLHCGDPISYTNLNSKYWQEHFYSYGRLP